MLNTYFKTWLLFLTTFRVLSSATNIRLQVNSLFRYYFGANVCDQKTKNNTFEFFNFCDIPSIANLNRFHLKTGTFHCFYDIFCQQIVGFYGKNLVRIVDIDAPGGDSLFLIEKGGYFCHAVCAVYIGFKFDCCHFILLLKL